MCIHTQVPPLQPSLVHTPSCSPDVSGVKLGDVLALGSTMSVTQVSAGGSWPRLSPGIVQCERIRVVLPLGRADPTCSVSNPPLQGQCPFSWVPVSRAAGAEMTNVLSDLLCSSDSQGVVGHAQLCRATHRTGRADGLEAVFVPYVTQYKDFSHLNTYQIFWTPFLRN